MSKNKRNSLPIGYGCGFKTGKSKNNNDKNKVNLQTINNLFKKSLQEEKGSDHFRGQIFQRNVSDNVYLPARGIVSLPIDLVNKIYDYAEHHKIKKEMGCEHLLTNHYNAHAELSRYKPRDSEADNQSKRLHRAIAYQIDCGLQILKKLGQKKGEKKLKDLAKKVILEAGDTFKDLLKQAIDFGKGEYNKRAAIETDPKNPPVPEYFEYQNVA